MNNEIWMSQVNLINGIQEATTKYINNPSATHFNVLASMLAEYQLIFNAILAELEKE